MKHNPLHKAGTYVIRPGARMPHAQAKAVLDTVAEMAFERNIPITESTVYEEGRDPKSRLHPYFEWNNDTCGELWRRQQAGRMVRSIMYVVRESTEKQDALMVRGFQPMMTPQGRRFVPVPEIAASKMMSNLVLAQLRRDAMVFIRRYENTREALPIIRMMTQWLEDPDSPLQ